MGSRILVFGAPGSFSFRLAQDLSHSLKLPLLDLFELFELPEKVHQHDVEPQLISQLKEILKSSISYVFHGSLLRFDLATDQYFDKIIFTHAPRLERINNLRNYYLEKEGEQILEEGSRAFRIFNQKMYWASQYDQAGMERDSKILHDDFCRKCLVPIFRFRAYNDERWNEEYSKLIESLGGGDISSPKTS